MNDPLYTKIVDNPSEFQRSSRNERCEDRDSESADDHDVSGNFGSYESTVSAALGQEQMLPESVENPFFQRQNNTGPKGVLADYRLHQALLKQEELLKQKELIVKIKKQSMALTLNCENDDQEVDLSLENDDDDVIKRYREHRLMELQDDRLRNAVNFEKPKYGELKRVDVQHLVGEIESAPSNALVVVLICSQSKESVLLERLFEEYLCHKYHHIKFLMVFNGPALKEVFDFLSDDDVLPSILAYRGGELLECMIRCCDYFGNLKDKEAVEQCLKDQNIL